MPQGVGSFVQKRRAMLLEACVGSRGTRCLQFAGQLEKF